MNPWPNFDFHAVDDPHFREDAVREELITPLLHALGYRATGVNQVQRSPRLVHPFVYLGTKKYPVQIVPDYILVRRQSRYCVIDAKSPSQNIVKGRAVEQAYSYAMHKDVRVGLYALCNGREFILYHVSRHPALVHFPLTEISHQWQLVSHYLGAESAADGTLPNNYDPDLGLHFHKTGLAMDDDGKAIAVVLPLVFVQNVGRVDDQTFCLHAKFVQDEEEYLATFDFGADLFPSFVEFFPEGLRPKIVHALRTSGGSVGFPNSALLELGLLAYVGLEPITNGNESFCPFEVKTFFPPLPPEARE